MVKSVFSIETAAEHIFEPRIRRYFDEVFSSYTAGNFRSAVVMLWSVVVCDLLFKLQFLAGIHKDPTAIAILEDIDKRRTRNARSPEWETALLESVKERTHLLDDAEFANLENLQTHRHLSAHPVLTAVDALYSPSGEMARAHIRNALEAVLTKPPIMTKRVFDAFLEDLESVSRLILDDESLRSYLEAKYFPHMVPAVENAIFRSLWRLVFKVVDERSEANRMVNLRALRVLYQRRPAECCSQVREDPMYYSEIAYEGKPLEYIVKFLGIHPVVFGLLSESARTPITTYARASLDLFANAWFLSESVIDHVKEVRRRITEEREDLSGPVFTEFASIARDHGFTNEILEMGIKLYGLSGDFATADRNFRDVLAPLLRELDEEQFEGYERSSGPMKRRFAEINDVEGLRHILMVLDREAK